MHYTHFEMKARYFLSGNTTSPTKIWIVLHGYRQQARYFIDKFESLADEDTLIIAPEGLHRFYIKGLQGKVGASWMTKEDRETDIINYLKYLNSILNSFSFYRQQNNNLEIGLIGFSQGAATASRWLNEGIVKFDKFVMWSSVFPPDLDFKLVKEQLTNCKTYFVYGNKDPFLSPEKVTDIKTILNALELNLEYITFDGGHDINEKVLDTISFIR